MRHASDPPHIWLSYQVDNFPYTRLFEGSPYIWIYFFGARRPCSTNRTLRPPGQQQPQLRPFEMSATCDFKRLGCWWAPSSGLSPCQADLPATPIHLRANYHPRVSMISAGYPHHHLYPHSLHHPTHMLPRRALPSAPYNVLAQQAAAGGDGVSRSLSMKLSRERSAHPAVAEL